MNIKLTPIEELVLSCVMQKCVATPGGTVKLFCVFDHLGALEKAVRVSWTYLSSELVVGYLTTVKVHASSSCLEYRHTQK